MKDKKTTIWSPVKYRALLSPYGLYGKVNGPLPYSLWSVYTHTVHITYLRVTLFKHGEVTI